MNPTAFLSELLRHHLRRLATLVLLAAAPVLQAQTVEQVFQLRAGWNAVYLRVNPTNAVPGLVFTNPAIQQVWTPVDPLTRAQFVQDSVSPLNFNEGDWRVWSPTAPAEVQNLSEVIGRRAYMIKVADGALNQELRIVGLPSVRPLPWQQDQYLLAGFQLDPSAPPTFRNYFRYSPAHYNTNQNVFWQPVWRLNAAGAWEQAPPDNAMKAGEAYWVFTKGASDFEALSARPSGGDDLDFDSSTTALDLEIHNRSRVARTVSLRLISPTVPGAIQIRELDTVSAYRWTTLPSPYLLNFGAEAKQTLTLSLRRALLGSQPFSALLEVADGAGTLIRIPITGRRDEQGSGGFTGLWIGEAEVTSVAEVHVNVTNATPTKTGFPLRMLIHVGTNGQVRLLKEVVQMWRDGAFTADTNGFTRVTRPGQFVLLTDETRFGEFQGSTLRDGKPVGTRVSSVGYEFEAGRSNYVVMAGQFGIGQAISVQLTNPPTAPTNPFRHKFHPDHDNLDVEFKPLTHRFEAYGISRQIELMFTPTNPVGREGPKFGSTEMAGIYTETLEGLHKRPITVKGSFVLRRASTIGVLNPALNP